MLEKKRLNSLAEILFGIVIVNNNNNNNNNIPWRDVLQVLCIAQGIGHAPKPRLDIKRIIGFPIVARVLQACT